MSARWHSTYKEGEDTRRRRYKSLDVDNLVSAKIESVNKRAQAVLTAMSDTISTSKQVASRFDEEVDAMNARLESDRFNRLKSLSSQDQYVPMPLRD